MASALNLSLSKSLEEAFSQLLATNQRALIAQIDGETVEHQQTIKGTADFEADFAEVAQHLEPDEPRYIIYNAAPASAPSYVFILFVPDTAKVRAKMLYASSATALKRQLLGGAGGGDGGAGAAQTIFWTELGEVSREGWAAHVAHEALAAPLTREEQSLRSVREKEADQTGTAVRRSHVAGTAAGRGPSGGSNVGMQFGADATAALEALGRADGGTVVLVIDVGAEQVHVGGAAAAAAGALRAEEFAADAAQFTVYKPAGARNEDTAVFYTCPPATKVKERMVYATNFKSVRGHVARALGVQELERTYEGSSGEDVVGEYLDDERKAGAAGSGKPEVVKAPRFSRPKAPGRLRREGAQ